MFIQVKRKIKLIEKVFYGFSIFASWEAEKKLKKDSLVSQTKNLPQKHTQK